MRRQIGVDPRPFTHIARNPHGRARFHRRVKLIRVAEAELIKQLREMNDAAERRLAAPAKRKRSTTTSG